MAHIFISYSKQDIDFARYLKTLLEAQDFIVWMDEAQLTPSSRWWRTIEENIDTCVGLVVVMSPSSAESDWVERELLRAEKMKRPIFPVLLRGDGWSRLANLQYADMRTGVQGTLPKDLITSLKRLRASGTDDTGIALYVDHGDVLSFRADVLALKYARGLHGADYAVFKQLADPDSPNAMATMPEVGDYTIMASRGLLGVDEVLFVGTRGIRGISYSDIQDLSQTTLRILADTRPNIKHLAMTVHGVRFGLDETESVRAQLAGYLEAIDLEQFPPSLKRITIVDIDEPRVMRLRTAIDEELGERNDVIPLDHQWGYTILPHVSGESIRAEESPPYAYVCMPDDAELEDVFYYGIQGAVHASGLLCVRVAGDASDAEVIKQSMDRLQDAKLVIAEVSEPTYPLYVQIGYALGKGCPLIVVTRNGDSLRWPVSDRIIYASIKDLERQMVEMLAKLRQM